MYENWGFTGSPFKTTSLPPSELGQQLLVGRDAELETLIKRISAPPKLATLEGLNGVGKTSVVNVASYRLFDRHIQTASGPLYIPCRKIFQLNPSQELPTFIDSVLMEVAQTLIDKSVFMQQKFPSLRTGGIDRWLNAPQLLSFQAGGWGFQAGYQSEMNTSSGFERSGFRKSVATLLEQVFPTPEAGGVICTIDNLELLQSSDVARQQLEQLRDELLNMPGLRWVLCGALGIVYGVVASPRLEGFLHKPIEVGKIDGNHSADILRSRISAFSIGTGTPYLPLRPDDFAQLYEILRGNLRSVLSYADDYCQWVSDGTVPGGDTERKNTFNRWLAEQAAAAHDAVRSELRPRAVQVFEEATSIGGIFSPSDFEDFKFNSVQAFRPSIRDLESVGLLVSTQDDGDKRRKTIQVTPKGWMVELHTKSQKAKEVV
ncbi:hypothetical protein VDG03_15700 [Xanthomonas campestris pv. raphani]|uniref:hypothetical protein n=1 Tax=Xanthomonas campestris TaxID=339 RepID=UPI002B228032|nr:hypothetical protein [Xanthomonas campestris]MEA9752433.1 hypothetical protein [Xanthomonas campestris pv. raphani]MEA9812689.1 hypothetical protein [Xanthomonas campestris pv. raphani]